MAVTASIAFRKQLSAVTKREVVSSHLHVAVGSRAPLLKIVKDHLMHTLMRSDDPDGYVKRYLAIQENAAPDVKAAIIDAYKAFCHDCRVEERAFEGVTVKVVADLIERFNAHEAKGRAFAAAFDRSLPSPESPLDPKPLLAASAGGEVRIFTRVG